MKHVMKKNSGGGDCDPRPKASENETTVGWSSYIALHIKKAKNRFRVLQDLKFRRRHSTYRVSNMEMVDCKEELLLHIVALFMVSFTFPLLPIMIEAQDSATNLKNAPNHRGYPSVEVSKNIVGPKHLLIGFSILRNDFLNIKLIIFQKRSKLHNHI